MSIVVKVYQNNIPKKNVKVKIQGVIEEKSTNENVEAIFHEIDQNLIAAIFLDDELVVYREISKNGTFEIIK